MTPEPAEIRLRRLRMRSWRRGTKEMDLILGRFADRHLESLGPEALDAYEKLLEENDHDLYRWISAMGSGRRPAPAEHHVTLGRIADDLGLV